MRPQTNLGLGHGGQDLAVQKLAAQLAVEALREPLLPRAAWGDIMRRGPIDLELGLRFRRGRSTGHSVP